LCWKEFSSFWAEDPKKKNFFFLKRALVLKKTDILISNSRLTTNARTDFVKRNFTEKELFKRWQERYRDRLRPVWIQIYPLNTT
jgi:hypothetical protein